MQAIFDLLETMRIAVATKYYFEGSTFKQIGSCAKGRLDIFHWEGGLAVTRRIIDVGQMV
jgi:hypothetical protein